jgi:hypothetical protein
MIINGSELTEELTKLADKIFIFNNVITNSQSMVPALDQIDQDYLIEQKDPNAVDIDYPISPWTPWLANDDDTFNYGKQKTARFDFDPASKDISKGHKDAISFCTQIKRCAKALSEEYFKHLHITDTPHLPNVFDIKVYNTGADMGRHFDLHPFEGNETILSAVIYLNDDYEGGELYFDQQDIKIKPKAGSVIFFPATADFTHASLEVTAGQKEAIPLFFYKYPEP